MGVVRKRVMLVLCCVVAIFLAAIAGWHTLEVRGFDSITASSKADTCDVARKLVELKGEKLAGIASDYSYWDEMVSFVKTRDPRWAKV